MKKPKEVRSKTSENKQTDNTISEKKLNKCEFCKEEFGINGLRKCNNILICEDCLEDYCEYCQEIKPFITVRKDFNDKEHTFKQLCSDCYLKLCNEIFIMDKSYGIESIDKIKAGNINEDI